MGVDDTDHALAAHWDVTYQTRGANRVSWFQAMPLTSLELIADLGLDPTDPILDVGGGASGLAGELGARGHRDVTVLDVSAEALAAARPRTGGAVAWVRADVLDWAPPRRYRLWHDRALFHFLTDPAQRVRYRTQAATTVTPGGFLIVGTFAADGPESCSGLPVTRYTPDHLAATFQPGFTSLATRRELHHTPAGATQPFTWQVLRRIIPSGPP